MKGIYILLIRISKNIQVKIGSLGKINFNKGIYAYVGSVTAIANSQPFKAEITSQCVPTEVSNII